MVRNIFKFVFVVTAASGQSAQSNLLCLDKMFTFDTNLFMAGVLATPVKRCPPGLNCGVGPECTVNDCGVEDCASAPVCQKRGLEFAADKVKRDPTPVVHPCPDICNEDGICGCALESLIANPSMVKRDPTPVNQKICPEICNTDGLCGCALESALATATP